jgi:hypothetical protein
MPLGQPSYKRYMQLQFKLNDPRLVSVGYVKTDDELIEELFQNVKTLHEENAKLMSENTKLKKRIEVILSEH